MKKFIIFPLLAGFIVLSLGLLSTYAHTLTGTTGLLNIPSAEIMQEGMLSVSYSHLRGNGRVGLSLGLFNGAEVGAVSILDGGGSDLAAGLKVKLLAEDQTWPAVAVGLELQNGDPAYYAVASKQIGVTGVRGHLGIGTGRFNRGVFGVSAVLNPVAVVQENRRFAMPVTSVISEYDGDGVNAGVVMHFNEELEARIFTSDLKHLGWGLKYTTRF